MADIDISYKKVTTGDTTELTISGQSAYRGLLCIILTEQGYDFLSLDEYISSNKYYPIPDNNSFDMVCYNTSKHLTLAAATVEEPTESSPFTFSVKINGISPDKHYYVRAGIMLSNRNIYSEELFIPGTALCDWDNEEFRFNIPINCKSGQKINVVCGDCNEMLLSGTFYMATNSTNTPSSANGWLTVKSFGDGSKWIYQEYITLHGDKYYRMRDDGTWGTWVHEDSYNSTAKLLCAGNLAMYMHGEQTLNLTEKISAQKNGIVICWSQYENGTAKEADFVYTFIPKWHVIAHNGCGVECPLSSTHNGGKIGTKYLYISDTSITGHANNSNVVGSMQNNYWVLRTVIGV